MQRAPILIGAEPQAGVTMANQDWETKLENELRIVRRLLALTLTQGKPKGQQIQLLSDAGMERQEIAQLVGTTVGTVSVEVSNLKKRRSKEPHGRRTEN
jgi:CRP-like cAMP-binding protein